MTLYAGRKFAAFAPKEYRAPRRIRRYWLADIPYNIDNLFGRIELERFQWKALNSVL